MRRLIIFGYYCNSIKNRETMKKVILIFVWVIIFVTVFTSCTNEGGNGPVNISLIEGKWNFNKSTATSSGFTIPYSTAYFKNEDGCTKDYIDILSGGIVKYADYSLNCALIEKDGTWTQSGNTLTIQVNGSSFNGTFNVTTLTATELVLKIDGTYSGQSGTLALYFTK
jgi:hypothetical protein